MLKAVPTTDAAEEPVTVSEVKSHLRITDNAEDILLAGMITAARKVVEQITRRAIIHQTWTLYLDTFPASEVIKLPYPPLAAVNHIKYRAQDGALTTFPSSEYQVDTRATPGMIVLEGDAQFPLTDEDKINAVEIEFVAGYGASAAAVPSPIRLAITHLVCHWFENREPFKDSAFQMRPVPQTFELLLMPWRFLSLG